MMNQGIRKVLESPRTSHGGKCMMEFRSRSGQLHCCKESLLPLWVVNLLQSSFTLNMYNANSAATQNPNASFDLKNNRISSLHHLSNLSPGTKMSKHFRVVFINDTVRLCSTYCTSTGPCGVLGYVIK
jgi:hypothetical protein